MKKFFYTGIIILAIFGSLSVLYFTIGCSAVAGTRVKDIRPISDFSAIDVSAGLEVILRQADSTNVIVETSEDFLPYVETRKEGNRLMVVARPKFRFFGMGFKHATVYITTPNIENLVIGSGCDVMIIDTLQSSTLVMEIASGSKLEGALRVEKYDLSVSSGSSLKLSGKFTTVNISLSSGSNVALEGITDDVKLNVASGSTIEGFDFIAKNLVCKVSSGSTVEMTVAETLDVTAGSGSSVKYKGSGKIVNSDISIGASLSNKN